ncbi:pyrroline-5-carboxylate reductase [Opitutaceae bacterium EW11]|nr:pyrroline-5-carboxylate reductase [Opitutaceae bacterium EW11]
MNPSSVGFIGGGRITRIILEGWRRSNSLPPHVEVSDPNAESLRRLQTRFPSVAVSIEPTGAAAQEVVFLATPPANVSDAARQIAPKLGRESIVVSLAPKLTLAALGALLNGFGRLARANPNAPSIVGAGFNPVAYSPALSAADRTRIRSLFSPLGECPEITEDKIEAFAVFTAMGPTYLWFQMQALRELAVGLGLSQAEADAGLRSLVTGAARTLLDSGLSPAEVMDLVPAKPLAEMEPQVLEFYRTRIPAFHAKIKP